MRASCRADNLMAALAHVGLVWCRHCCLRALYGVGVFSGERGLAPAFAWAWLVICHHGLRRIFLDVGFGRVILAVQCVAQAWPDRLGGRFLFSLDVVGFGRVVLLSGAWHRCSCVHKRKTSYRFAKVWLVRPGGRFLLMSDLAR